MSDPRADDLTKRLFVWCRYVTLESRNPGIGDLARLRINYGNCRGTFPWAAPMKQSPNDKRLTE